MPLAPSFDIEQLARQTHPWAAAAVVVVAAGVLAYLVRRALRRVVDRGEPGRVIGRQLGRIASIIIVLTGLVWALQIAGVEIGPLVGALGLGGIAIAFAAQDILQNFISGLILQVQRPFRVGDQVTANGYEGTVLDVDLRSVRILTFDGLDVVLPAQQVLSAAIVNHTARPMRRTNLPVGLAYDTDLERARQVLLEAVRSVPDVQDDPPPMVWVHEFGDSSINLDVLFWHGAEAVMVRRVRNDVAIALKKALDAAGMEIPFPQRVVHRADAPAGDRTASG